MDTFWAVVAGLIPSIGVGLLFWLAMRKIIRADRNERAALEEESIRVTENSSGNSSVR